MIKTGSGPPIPISESGRAGMGSGPPIPMKTSSGRPKTCSVKLPIRMKMSAKPIRTGQLMGTIPCRSSWTRVATNTEQWSADDAPGQEEQWEAAEEEQWPANEDEGQWPADPGRCHDLR